MSELTSIRAIAFPSIPAAALAVLFTLFSGDGPTQLLDQRQPLVSASVPYLGEMAVVARRIPQVQVASSREDATFLGAMTITAARLPAATASTAALSHAGAPRLTKASPGTVSADSSARTF